MATCPHCKKAIISLKYKTIEATEEFNYKNSVQMIAVSCKVCDSVLSVEVNPLALRNSIVQGIKSTLKSSSS